MPLNSPSSYHSYSFPTTTPQPPSSTTTAATFGKPPLPPPHLPPAPPRLLRAPPPQTLYSRARAQIATFRPWRELLDPSSLSLPYTYGEAMSRLRRNINYFRMNYAMVMLFVLFCSLIYHPFSMITFLVIFIAWMFLCFFRDDPVILLGRLVDDRFVIICLGLITIVALVLTDVGLNVLVALIIGVAIVGLHGTFRGVEDLFLDETEAAEGGLVSVVGGEQRPLTGGY